MKGTARLVLLCGVLALLAGCAESATEPEAPPPDAEVLAGIFGMAGADSRSGTYPCPAGGERTVEFEATFTPGDDEITAEFRATVKHDACGMRAGTVNLVTDGVVRLEAFERRTWEDDRPGRLLERYAHQTGSLRWRGDGHDRTCDIDITETFDIETGTRTFSGSICGHPVNFSHPLRS